MPEPVEPSGSLAVTRSATLKLFVSWKWEGFAIKWGEFFNWSERIFIAPIVAWLIDDWPTNL